MKEEVNTCIGKAARAFGCLQRSIFQNRHLSAEMKQKVYQATGSVILYGSDPHRIPKQLLFGELQNTRCSQKVKRRWRDLAQADLKVIGLGDDWYEVAQD